MPSLFIPNPLPNMSAYFTMFSECNLISSLRSKSLFSRALTRSFLIFFPSRSFSWYILSSASFIISLICSSSDIFVAHPSDILGVIVWYIDLLHKSLILEYTFFEFFKDVCGRRIANSSPPHLARMSSWRIPFLSIFDISMRSLSPSIWLNASLRSLRPLTSPIIIVSGSCLFVSSLDNCSSK